MGRLIFLPLLMLLAAAIWRISGSGSALVSYHARQGEITDVELLGDTVAVSLLRENTVRILAANRVAEVALPRPLRLVRDGSKGLYVVGLLQHEIHRLNRLGELGATTVFPRTTFITGVLRDGDFTWVTGYFKSRYEDRKKRYVYLPEHSNFMWFVLRFRGELPAGKIRVPDKPKIHGVSRWHEESGGAWQLHSDEKTLFVVNDQAETLVAIAKDDNVVQWEVETGPRPTGSVLWRDRLIVATAQGGFVEAFNKCTGERAWRSKVGRGVTDLALFAGVVVAANWRTSELLLLDPETGETAKTVSDVGAPRFLTTFGDTLFVTDAERNAVHVLGPSFEPMATWTIDTGGAR